MSEVKCFPVQVKLKAVYRIWAGEKITEVARECGISRQVLYCWKRKAEMAVSQALEKRKRGPKFHEMPEDNRVVKMREKVKVEKAQQKVKFRERMNKLPHSSNNNKRPQQCPVCGCEKIYKNGTYIKKNGNKNHLPQVIQRYICVWCKSPVYLE